MTSSCDASKNYSDEPIKPDLPKNVYPKVTKIPKGPIGTKKTSKLLVEFKKNEKHNVRAINSARKSWKYDPNK